MVWDKFSAKHNSIKNLASPIPKPKKNTAKKQSKIATPIIAGELIPLTIRVVVTQ